MSKYAKALALRERAESEAARLRREARGALDDLFVELPSGLRVWVDEHGMVQFDRGYMNAADIPGLVAFLRETFMDEDA